MGVIVDGVLFDCLCCVVIFGLFLVCLDVCQDLVCYVVVLSEIIEYLELGSYDEWDEKICLEFFFEELNSCCFLLLVYYQFLVDIVEVFVICWVIVVVLLVLLGFYVILMVGQLFDVLVV